MNLHGVLSFLLFSLPIHCSLDTPFWVYKASHVVKKLWQLPLDGFNNTVVDIVAQYKCDKKSLLDIKNCAQFIHHCGSLHIFFKHIYLDSDGNSLWYIQQEESAIGKVDLISYWRAQSFEPFFCFYALYYDCLAQLFVLELNQAWHEKHTDEYSEWRLKAERRHSEMSTVSQYLSGSSFEECYSRQHARYYDLLAFVQVEKDKLIHE